MSDHSDSPAPGGRNLLLQTGEDGDCEESACMDLLGVEDPAGVDVLFVTFTKSADDRLEALKRHADAPPARVGVVSVQVGGSNGGDRVGAAGGPTVRRISDPSDLTGVGIAISEFLSAWSGDGNRTVVCFESLTALLQYVDASRVFQFCNEITSKFEQAGATAHFHITPEAHERQELSVLSSLFDGRVSAADLGYGAGAAASTGAGADAGAPDADPGSTDAPDGSSGDGSSDPGSATETEDPFEYAGDGAADPADDVASTDVDESTGAGAAEPGDGTDSQPDGEPADLVSSVIAGESDDGDDADADDTDAIDDTDVIDDTDAEAPEGGRPDAAPDVADVSDASDDADGGADDPTEGTAADGDLPEPEDDGPPEGADEPRPAATARQAEHEERRRRLQYVGPGASSGDGSTGGGGGADRDRTAQATGSDDPAEGGDKYAFYQRTTATVVGVVVMLVLISFLSAAMPVPVTPDDAADGDDVSPTATPEEVAAANESATETATATEDASTPTPTATATATPTPTPDSSTSSSTSSGSSDDGSTGDSTATPTATPTPTPTDTPSDDTLIDDTLDTTDDLL